jgi:hypothetical protein
LQSLCVGDNPKGIVAAVLLADALKRAFESASTVRSSMVIVHALDERTAGFYAAHGFARLPESLRLVLPTRVVGEMVEQEGKHGAETRL